MQDKDLESNDPRLIVHNSLSAVAIAIAYFLAHQISFFYPDSKQVLMAVWPAAGFGLAALLLSPRNLWPATFLIMDDEDVMRDTIGDMLRTFGNAEQIYLNQSK